MGQRRQLDVQVDPIEQRTREPAEIPAAFSGRAHAEVQRWAAPPARVGRAHELEARRKVADATGSRDGDPTVLEGLPE